MTATSDASIAAVRSTHDELTARVRGLTDEQLLAPSGSSQWPVALSVARLVSCRLTPAHTPADVRVSGAVTLEDLRRVFPGY